MTWFTVMKLKTSEVLLSIMLGKAVTLKLGFFFLLVTRYCSHASFLFTEVLIGADSIRCDNITCDNKLNICHEK